jgi:hypothetical protein
MFNLSSLLVVYFCSSSFLFRYSVQHLNGKELTVVQDVPTRWSSTHSMCSRLVELKRVLLNMELNEEGVAEHLNTFQVREVIGSSTGRSC